MAKSRHGSGLLRRRPLKRAALHGLWLSVLVAGCDLDERTLTFSVGEPITPSASGSDGSSPDTSSPGGEGGSSSDGGVAAGAASGTGDASGGKSTGGASSGGASTGGTNTGGLHGEPNGGSNAGGSANAGTATGGFESGGMPNGGTPNGGVANGGTGVAGSAGSGGAPFISPCGDLNQNRVDDCEETLVNNSRFDTDASTWEAETLLQQRWAPVNASGGSASGALSVANVNVIPNLGGSTTVGSRQCMRAWTGQHFAVGARVFIKGGQGAGKAGVNLLIFSTDGCTGDGFITGKTIDTVADVDAWRVIEGEVAMPAASRSMYVRLVAEKPFAQASLEVLFDDVLVSEKK
jgi:hypothetical protein